MAIIRSERSDGLPSPEELDAAWSRHHAAWRDQAQIASQWRDADETDPNLFRCQVTGAWWETLAATGATFLVTREYEHLVMGLRADDSGPHISFMRLPHPSGIVVDRARGIVHVASTRNPNQVFDLAPVTGVLQRLDVEVDSVAGSPLIPIASRFYPGCFYLHDLALIGGQLYANAVGQNAIVRLDPDGRHEKVWWPRCIETDDGPRFGQNYLQLNSIASGPSVETSFFSATAEKISARRPGHRNFPVDKRGVLFDGATREPRVRGLTRPHSARRHGERVWIDNSGYGDVGFEDNGRYQVVARLPGWTRGLCFHERIAFVGTSRIIPRFRQYAPGLDADRSVCGIHAVDTVSGAILGSIIWPWGNQIFGIDWIPSDQCTGFAFPANGRRSTGRIKTLFYAFKTDTMGDT